MATIQAQIEAAKKAGYTVWEDGTTGKRFRFTTPRGDHDSAKYGEGVAAWNAAYEHLQASLKRA